MYFCVIFLSTKKETKIKKLHKAELSRVNQNNIDANFKDGVLIVKILKKNKKSIIKVNINVE